MKKSLTILFLLSAMVGMGQTKPDTALSNAFIHGTTYTDRLSPSLFHVLAIDTSEEIFSFRMTGDTAKLKPVDTAFYTMGNTMYREIKYRYIVNKSPMYLMIRSYNDSHHWIFFSFQLYDKL